MKMAINIISTVSLFAAFCSPVLGGELESRSATLQDSFGALSVPAADAPWEMDIPAPVRAESDPAWLKFNGLYERGKTNGSKCCTSSAACTRIKTDGFAALGVQPADLSAWDASLAAFKTITSSRWYATFPDGNALTDGDVGSIWVTRKSFVGIYQFKIEKMSVVVDWNPDPILGFDKPGTVTMGISKVCFAPDRIQIFTRGNKMEMDANPRSTLIQPSPNTGTDKPVLRNSYLMTTDYGQYLFSSDGK